MATRKWKTQDGRELHVVDMSTSHIENALAMLERHLKVRTRQIKFVAAFKAELKRRKRDR